jgi:hypothetical protein
VAFFPVLWVQKTSRRAFGFALLVNLTPAADSQIMKSAVVGQHGSAAVAHLYGTCEKLYSRKIK